MVQRPSGPLALIILDGWGLREDRQDNAIALADTPFFDRLMRDFPHSRLKADGEAVGLMEGQMGNSNVGHLNLGAGRVVYQDLVRIQRSIRSGSLARNEVLSEALTAAAVGGRTLHLLGLVSDGGVHSHIDHLLALLEIAVDKGIRAIQVHAFLDGRDVPPKNAAVYLERLQEKLQVLGAGRIATIAGRYFAMDRDNRWQRTEKAYRAMLGNSEYIARDSLIALQQAYERGETDEFVSPTVIEGEADVPTRTYRISPDDVLIFFNFRADRARQLTRAFTQADFQEFSREVLIKRFYTMTEYDPLFGLPVIFPPVSLDRCMGEVVADQGWPQLRSAETEKYPHVTYFFNGGREEPYPLEDRLLVPSPKVPTYDLQPEMSAPELAERLCQRLEQKHYRFVVLNFANPDMVGHTGILEAAVQAVETVDRCLEKVVSKLWSMGGGALVIADHGNAECMRDPATGQPHTAHTLNRVPCILALPGWEHCKLSDGILADVAPTLLDILGVPKPEVMDGRNLINCENQRECMG